MQAASKDGVPLFWPGLVVVLALAGGVWWVQPPFTGSRATGEPGCGLPPMRSDQNIEARLWEDPFAALERSQGQPGGPAMTLKDMAEQVHRKLESSNRVALLAVMATGSRYAEDFESRIRSRLAIVAALARQGYVAADSEHIGKFEAPWPREGRTSNGIPVPVLPAPEPVSAASSARTSADQCLLVPFEWFEREKTSDWQETGDLTNAPASVLLWYLRDDGFSDHPLTRLAMLFSSLRCSVENAGTADRAAGMDARLTLKVIGPRTSSGLSTMLEDLARLSPSPSSPPPSPEGVRFSSAARSELVRLTIYSPWATASDAALLGGDASAGDALAPPRTRITELFAREGISFKQVIATDDLVCRALIGELQLRGVACTNADASAAIVLLSEYDTAYGRALPRVFAAELALARGMVQASNYVSYLRGLRLTSAFPSPTTLPSNLFLYGYLRGTDGELAQQPRSDLRNAEPTSKESVRDRAKRLERAEGRGQLDALRRLGADLWQLDRDLRLTQRTGIAAIGLLGSDVPDKLLLLQALREQIPGAVFFTTDLDARMSHPTHLRWSRNLVVASGYGLALSREWQQGVPPFRECYQPAQYLACLMALGATGLSNVVPPPVVVHEIGETRAVHVRSIPDEPAVHPARPPRPAASQAIGLPILIAFVLGGVAWLTTSGLRSTPSGLTLRSIFMVPAKQHHLPLLCFLAGAALLLGALPVFFVAWIRWQSGQPEGEPFAWWDGVSVWPTELLRLATVYLCVWFYLHAHRRLHQAEDELTTEFALKPDRWRNGAWPPPAAVQQWRTDRQASFEARYRLARWLAHHHLAVPTWVRRLWAVQIRRLGEPSVSSSNEKGGGSARTWQDYRVLASFGCRFRRVLPLAALYLAGAVLLFFSLGLPAVPFRGPHRFISDTIPLLLSVVSQILLLFFVLDAVVLCHRMTDVLVREDVRWPGTTLQHFGLRDAPPVQAWLDVEFIARLTRSVMPLIYYPFALLTLMIVARLNLTDRWDWPPALLLVFGLNTLLAFVAVWSLRRGAERARKTSLVRAYRYLARLDVAGGGERSVGQAKTLILQIEQNREGAFAPVSEQPFIRALLLPFGGLGFAASLDALARL